MKAVLVFLATEKPTPFAEVLQLTRAKLAGQMEGVDATLTEPQARQFGSAAKVRAPFQLVDPVTTWRDECLLRHNAEVGVVFYAKSRDDDPEQYGVWMCGWVEGEADDGPQFDKEHVGNTEDEIGDEPPNDGPGQEEEAQT